MAADRPGTGEGTYVLSQHFRYAYASPVRRLRHRLMVVPRAVHGDQRRLEHRVTVAGSPAHLSTRVDRFGNDMVEVSAAEGGNEIEFEAWALVRRNGPGGETPVPAAAAADRQLVHATRLTRADGRLADAARELAAQTGGYGLALAEGACSWAHDALTYEYGVTTVRQT